MAPGASDTLDEVDEIFQVNLSRPTGAIIADSDSAGIGTIHDNDLPPTVSINDVSIVEGHGDTVYLTFTVSLSAASGKRVRLDYATADDTATAGSDYTAKSGSLIFSPGQTVKIISVAVRGDTLREDNETFRITLLNALDAVLADSVGIGMIRNDD